MLHGWDLLQHLDLVYLKQATVNLVPVGDTTNVINIGEYSANRP